MKDKPAWQMMILEHRRILLERLITEFPQVMTTHKSKISLLRHQLDIRKIR